MPKDDASVRSLVLASRPDESVAGIAYLGLTSAVMLSLAVAKRRTADFLTSRVPKYLGYFEKVLGRNKARGGHLIGARLSYPDLSLFQVVAGLRYAFPRAMTRLEPKYPRVVALHDAVVSGPRIAGYLASDRRIAFNRHGIFRHYPELDEG